MIQYSFTVDDKLAVQSWDPFVEVIHDIPPGALKGARYFEIFPRLWDGAEDAVARVISEGKPLVLRGYRQACF